MYAGEQVESSYGIKNEKLSEHHQYSYFKKKKKLEHITVTPALGGETAVWKSHQSQPSSKEQTLGSVADPV